MREEAWELMGKKLILCHGVVCHGSDPLSVGLGVYGMFDDDNLPVLGEGKTATTSERKRKARCHRIRLRLPIQRN